MEKLNKKICDNCGVKHYNVINLVMGSLITLFFVLPLTFICVTAAFIFETKNVISCVFSKFKRVF